MNSDPLTSALETCKAGVSNLPPTTYWLILRLTFAIAVPTLLCSISHTRLIGKLSLVLLVWFQWGLAIIGVLTALELPIDKISLSSTARLWAFALSLFGLATLPLALSYLLIPLAGPRRILAITMYASITFVIVANAIVR